MISRILLAVDDSPAALTATEVTLDLASRLGARVLAVNVVSRYLLSTLHASGSGISSIDKRQEPAAAAVLRHVARMAERATVDLETQQLEGDVARHVLGLARGWHADLIVIGRSGQRAPGEPYVGSETAHVLEFAELPVLVVPRLPVG
jgi:nucleotide-binding universal stress UspA family protein